MYTVSREFRWRVQLTLRDTNDRGSYCALSVASLLNMITPELTQSMGSFITACQSYEGGIGGEPGIEAHGGYSYCGLAALCLLKHHGFDQSLALFNVDSLLEWTCHRQMTIEGGFQGRTNKLVDACYSLWQGGVFPLLECYFSRELRLPEDRKTQLWDRKRLQEYLLVCCQGKFGGIRDKPVK